MDDYKHIRELANADVDTLQRKNEEYGSSWRKRGGIGAFMMLARKWDRLETQCQDAGYDIFLRIKAELDAGIVKDGILDDIRDLRAYLLLVESHATAPKCSDVAVQNRPMTVEDYGMVNELATEGEPGPGYVNQDPEVRPKNILICPYCESAGLYHAPGCPNQAQPRQA